VLAAGRAAAKQLGRLFERVLADSTLAM